MAWEVSPRALEVAPGEVAKAWAQVASVAPPSSAVEKVALATLWEEEVESASTA